MIVWQWLRIDLAAAAAAAAADVVIIQVTACSRLCDVTFREYKYWALPSGFARSI